MKPHDLHAKAEAARETDNHLEALKLLDEAIVLYQKEKNYGGVCEALQSRVLTYKHLYFLTNDLVFAQIAQKEAEASLEIAQKNNLKNKLSSCYFRLAEISMLFENFPQAASWYRKSLDVYSGTLAEKGDYTYHLGEALWRNGQKEEGKKLFEEGLDLIQKNSGNVDPFLIHVWESGLLMKLADLSKDESRKAAKQYLDKAKKIIDSDPKLVIRKRQFREFAKKFK